MCSAIVPLRAYFVSALTAFSIAIALLLVVFFARDWFDWFNYFDSMVVLVAAITGAFFLFV